MIVYANWLSYFERINSVKFRSVIKCLKCLSGILSSGTHTNTHKHVCKPRKTNRAHTRYGSTATCSWRRGWWIKDGLPGQLLLAEKNQQQGHPRECSMALRNINNPGPVQLVSACKITTMLTAVQKPLLTFTRSECLWMCLTFIFFLYLSCSWDWWLRPREASWRLQLQIPVLP